MGVQGSHSTSQVRFQGTAICTSTFAHILQRSQPAILWADSIFEEDATSVKMRVPLQTRTRNMWLRVLLIRVIPRQGFQEQCARHRVLYCPILRTRPSPTSFPLSLLKSTARCQQTVTCRSTGLAPFPNLTPGFSETLVAPSFGEQMRAPGSIQNPFFTQSCKIKFPALGIFPSNRAMVSYRDSKKATHTCEIINFICCFYFFHQ